MNYENCMIQFNSNVAKGNDGVRIAFYSNIGFFIEVAQMLEFNLRKFLCYYLSVREIEAGEINKENVTSVCKKYDEFYIKTYSDKLTLGQLVGTLDKYQLLKEIIPFIRDVNNYRIQVVHKIFQNNIIVKEFESSEYVQNYLENRLIPMTDKTLSTNEFLVNSIRLYMKALHEHKSRVGIKVDE